MLAGIAAMRDGLEVRLAMRDIWILSEKKGGEKYYSHVNSNMWQHLKSENPLMFLYREICEFEGVRRGRVYMVLKKPVGFPLIATLSLMYGEFN